MQLLNQITPGTAKTLELEDYLFHYIHENGLLTLCMADKDVAKKLAFSFLQDVRQCFLDKYSSHDIDVANGFALKSFGNIYMKPKMNFYNENPDCATDKADELLNKMLTLKEDMVENIESLIQRDGKIDVIAEKAHRLSVVSHQYKNNSRKLKEQERRKRYCYVAMIASLVMIVIAILLYVLFG